MRFIFWLLFILGLLMFVPALQEASAAPLCEHRSAAHIAEHGGLKADSAWHIAHGDLPTCDDSRDEQRRDDTKVSAPQQSNDKQRDNDRDKKSRWCREHWYC